VERPALPSNPSTALPSRTYSSTQPIVILFAESILAVFHSEFTWSYSHAPLRISEILMISHQVLFVKRILLDALVILQTLEKHLAEAIKIRNDAHLRIDKLAHQRSRRTLVVDLRDKSAIDGGMEVLTY
jgi:hypothetical protein